VNILETKHFAQWTGGYWTSEAPSAVEGFNIDSRIVRPGQMFVAISTSSRDGHRYVEDAQSKGASAALVSRKVMDCPLPQLVVEDTQMALWAIAKAHRESYPGIVIGISGSCGKTSTKDLLAELFHPKSQKTPGNLNNHLGVPLTLTSLHGDSRYAVVEVGMNIPGEIEALSELIQPDYAIITGIAPVHLQGVGSLEGVAQEKSALAKVCSKLCVLPVECFRYAGFSDLDRPCLILGKPEASRPYPDGARFLDYSIKHDTETTHLEIGEANGAMVFRQARLSQGMARNRVLAIALALELGLGASQIQSRLDAMGASRLRGERIRVGELEIFVDCYNANPVSMRDALEFFQATTDPGQTRHYVLGGMKELGEYTEDYHRELGRSFRLRPNDHLLLTGKEMQAFVEGYQEAGRDDSRMVFFHDKEEAVRLLKGANGNVFIKGSRAYLLENIVHRLKEELFRKETTQC